MRVFKMRSTWWWLILDEHDTEPAELTGGVMKVSIGLWLLLPFDTFASSPTFAVFSILPEWLWGGALMALGVAHLVSLRSGDIDRRRHGATVGWLTWFSFATVFVFTNPPALGWIAFLIAGLAQLWASIRLGRPA